MSPLLLSTRRPSVARPLYRRRDVRDLVARPARAHRRRCDGGARQTGAVCLCGHDHRSPRASAPRPDRPDDQRPAPLPRNCRPHRTAHHESAHAGALTTALHHAPQGTLSFWFSPLENLTSSPGNSSDTKVPFEFPFVTDAFPGRESSRSHFGVSFIHGYPALVPRFTNGRTFPKLDYGLAPFVYAEKVLLRRGHWYHLALVWDRPAQRLRLWLNGFMAGHNDRSGPFDPSAAELFLGNPMMVLRDVRLEARALDDAAVRARYRADRPPENDLLDAYFRRLLEPAFLAPLDLRRDATWKLAYKNRLHPRQRRRRVDSPGPRRAVPARLLLWRPPPKGCI